MASQVYCFLQHLHGLAAVLLLVYHVGLCQIGEIVRVHDDFCLVSPQEYRMDMSLFNLRLIYLPM